MVGTNSNMTYSEVADVIRKKDALIFCHANPDMDTVGSAIALGEIISMTGGAYRIVCSDPMPERFSFLIDGMDTSYRDGDENGKFVICVDIASKSQLGKLSAIAEKTDLMIDHHSSGEIFANGIVEPCTSAAGVIVYELYMYMVKNREICESAKAARALYSAIASDTGSFRYSNTDSRAHFAAGYLIDIINNDKYGINTSEISRILFETKTYGEITAQRLAAEKLNFYENGRLAVSLLTLSDLKACGIAPSDCSCNVDIARSVSGVYVGIAMRETAPGEFRLSSRANYDIDVSAVCSKFGGGGHKRAAGATVFDGSPENAEKRVADAFSASVREYVNAKK